MDEPPLEEQKAVLEEAKQKVLRESAQKLQQQSLERFFSSPHKDSSLESCEIKRVNEYPEIIQKHAIAGESIHIWYSKYPDEICGLYWFVEQLHEWKVQARQIFVLKTPKREANENSSIWRWL